jgi:hypothetical protein
VIGEKSVGARFNDGVKIEVELTEPAHAYLLAFNPDGTEQLLWPVNRDKLPDGTVLPELVKHLRYPARDGKWLYLNDAPKGGMQAFALVASPRPLPAFQEWRAKRGPAAWRKLPALAGVWSSDGEGVYPVLEGRTIRAKEGDLPGAPPLVELCRFLRRPGMELVEALAFPVRPRDQDE